MSFFPRTLRADVDRIVSRPLRNAAPLAIAAVVSLTAFPAAAEAGAPPRAVVRVCTWSANPGLIGSPIRFSVNGKPTFALLGATREAPGCSPPFRFPVGKTVTIIEDVPTSIVISVKPVGVTRIRRIKGATVTITVRPDGGGTRVNIVQFENEAA